MSEDRTVDRYDDDGRHKLPLDRTSITHRVDLAGHTFYITAGMYQDGSLGELFIKNAGKEGSTVQGLLDSFATMFSIGLQYGASLDTLIRKFAGTKFEPMGHTDNQDIPQASSMIDYIVRWAALRFGTAEVRTELGIPFTG